jgi:GNAT superfamily N-acetyltransferase
VLLKEYINFGLKMQQTFPPIHIRYKGYLITSDKATMNIQEVHQWLSEHSYWAAGIPYTVVERSIDESFCLGALLEKRQVGFARLITDYSTFAYLADVYVLEVHRSHGVAKKMMELLFNQDWVQGLRRIMLATVDAHGLYAKYGFAAPSDPAKIMEIKRQDIYKKQGADNRPLLP